MPLTPQYNANQQKALDALDNYNRQLEQIRLNGQISHAGKQNAIAALWGRTVKEQKAQQDAMMSDHQRLTAALEREVFGLRPGATAEEIALYRNAAEQTSNITDPAAALSQLRSAALSGDTTLAKTVLAQAIREAHSVPIPAMAAPWAEVANAYIEMNPAAEAKVEALWEAKAAGGVIENIAFHPPAKPLEVQSLTDAELLGLAE
ncbi:hypothetical protein [Leifsonia sp. Le1]|uniref:hypothetical protein n=1 Tax=Leifsonia sp. Le1 TaxID=3404918 RepID=UPI003EBD2980